MKPQKAKMPPRKGAKQKVRNPNCHNTRGDSSLDIETQKQLYIDLESSRFSSETSAGEILASDPDLYGTKESDPQRYRALCDKIRRLRKKKEEDPSHYW